MEDDLSEDEGIHAGDLDQHHGMEMEDVQIEEGLGQEEMEIASDPQVVSSYLFLLHNYLYYVP